MSSSGFALRTLPSARWAQRAAPSIASLRLGIFARSLALVRHGLPAGLLRAKGFFWLAEQPADIGFLSVAGGVARVEFIGTWVAELRERHVITEAEIPASARSRWCEPHGDRRQELVFIGTGLDAAAWRQTLADCLA